MTSETSSTDGTTASGHSWLSLNMFPSSVPPPDPASTPKESSGLLHGIFSSVKTRFLGAGESIRNTASNIYHRNYKYFAIAFGCGVALIGLSFFFLPLVTLSPQKFCLLFTLGSLCILASFAFLQEPLSYVASMFSGQKLIFTCCYLGSIILSIYSSMVAKKYLATVFCTALQVSAICVYP